MLVSRWIRDDYHWFVILKISRGFFTGVVFLKNLPRGNWTAAPFGAGGRV
jgi:hypothetical protein